ncbi:hypothetical protein [Paraburkholderia sp. BCC1886]|uniref:hypothetical protein n=1 Tax=Paraburkholderia sp. BCC1886 TaxID=2562670 RepID=UPI0016423E0B|nr:hypothetical protein [Paraburkholderia sp. BCC1886]
MLRNRAAALAATLTILALPTASDAAPTELASIAVSLVVQETCSVQSADLVSVADQPAVTCLHSAPFQVNQLGFDPVGPEDTATSTAQPVDFAATHGVQQTVWTVKF